jgi:hypothetical protein
MFSRVSFYGCPFFHPFECIIRYDILWRGSKKYLLKRSVLNEDYENTSEEITVMVYSSSENCSAGIIRRFRNHEIETLLYQKLKPVDKLPQEYQPLLAELKHSITAGGIKSFGIFGNLRNTHTRHWQRIL